MDKQYLILDYSKKIKASITTNTEVAIIEKFSNKHRVVVPLNIIINIAEAINGAVNNKDIPNKLFYETVSHMSSINQKIITKLKRREPLDEKEAYILGRFVYLSLRGHSQPEKIKKSFPDLYYELMRYA